MDGNKIRINFKKKSPPLEANGPPSSASTIRGNSRSRSRLPVKDRDSWSPGKSPYNAANASATSLTSSYRERSCERSADKLHKSTLYKKENTSLQDIPLLNTSFNNKIKLPEFQQEQDTRGRSRDRPRNEAAVQELEERGRSAEIVDDDSDDPNMISLMGFSGFGSTKGKHVAATKGGAVKQEKKSEYRQYMNRNKGFNRALSPGR